MKRFLVFLCAAGLVFGVASFAGATLINGDFETGDFSGWTTWGDVEVRTTLSGNDYAFLDDNDSSGFAGLAQSFYLDKGTVGVNISFDYKFKEIDEAWYTDIFTSTFAFRSAETPYFNMKSLVFEASSTGLVHFDASYEVSGLLDEDPNGLISFNLTEARGFFGDQTNSWVGLDNVMVNAVGSPVPEPGTMLLLGVGLIGLAGIGRKKLFKNA